ncbi:MAG: FecR domain-containing protein [Fibrobacteraceae bacterium]|nr:FecR domain-containing protein [Fibrobacteraceae bacterium]
MTLKVFVPLCLATLLTIPTSLLAAAPSAGKVRAALGEVDRRKEKQADWSKLRVGASIFQTDLVRTGVESEVTFGLLDGSTITLAEKTEVHMMKLLEGDGKGAFKTRLDIKQGHINFTVQKLQEKNSTFEFKTGTATASIRGTEGYIGGEKTFFAGLKNGRLEITADKSGQTVSIGEGETTFGKDSLMVLKLKSSGDAGFAKKIEALLQDSTKSMDQLAKDLQSADEAYQKELARTAAMGAPSIKFVSYDSVRCVANVAITDIKKGEPAVFVVARDDGSPSEETVSRNGQKRFKLSSGIHEYVLTMRDKNGNENQVSKTLGCFPVKPFKVVVEGNTKEILNIPPPTPGMPMDQIPKTLRFQIRIPENDPVVLYQVLVKQNGNVILKENLAQISNLDYGIPVTISRNNQNRFDIEVTHKSGYKAKVQKIYEVR